MSDLHRAVQSEIDSFRPDRTPPFSVLQARKRTRDRRRYALSGVALSVAAVTGVAVVSTTVADDRLVTPGTVAAPAPTSTGPAGTLAAGKYQLASFTVQHLDAGFVNPGTAERLDACLALPGVEHSSKPVAAMNYSVNVTGDRRTEAFVTCVKALAADGIVLTEHRPPPLETDADVAAFVEECLYGLPATETPELVGKTEAEVFPANARNAIRVLGRDGVCNMGSPVPNYPNVVLVDGTVVWAGVLDFDSPTATEPSATPASGPEVLLHHCGIRPVTFDDRQWEVTEAPFDATNAPSTFSGEGTYTLSGDTLVFADRAGARLVFTPDDGKANRPPCA